jgi:predicted O-linked N-acetylglucosamine transferase (SPINDLY family)/predicted O-methyltransferase YrrM
MTVVQELAGVAAAMSKSDLRHLLEAENWQVAEAAARERLAVTPEANDAVVLVNALLGQGNFTAADAAASDWLAVFVDDPRLLTARAEARTRLGAHAEARHDANRAVLFAPEEPAAWVGLAEALSAAGENEDAQDAYLTALALGDQAAAAFRAARFWVDHELLDEGLKVLREIESTRALTAAELWCVGLLHQEAGDEREAASAFRAGLHAAKANAPVSILAAAADAFRSAGQNEEALAALERALARKPEDPDLLLQRVNVLRELDRNVEAIEESERLLPRLPSEQRHALMLTLSNLHSRMGEHREALSYLEACDAAGYELALSQLCMVINHEAYGSDDGARLLRRARQIRERARSIEQVPLTVRHQTQRRIRVGLLSNSFGCHPVGWLTIGAFEALDRDRYEIICFSTHERRDDPIARRFRLVASEYVVLEGLSDDLAVREMVMRGLDVLIDLQGYSGRARMELVMRKPARAVLKWVGMQAYTYGIEAIDAMIADALEVPPELEHLYTEKIVRIPGSYISYAVPEQVPEVSAPPVEQNGYITFGFFNNLQKMSDPWLAAAARILDAVPQSRLLFKTRGLGEPKARERFERRLEGHGIALERCAFAGRTPHFEHLKAISSVDIALDSFPYTGGLTTLECALMGVPTVARYGSSFASRHSLSHLANLGLGELCAASDEEFVAKAVALAADPARLGEYRRRLRARLLEAGGLGDHRRAGEGLARIIDEVMVSINDQRAVVPVALPEASIQKLPSSQITQINILIDRLMAERSLFQENWSAERNAILIGAQLLIQEKPRKLLEFGSGLSTLVFSQLCRLAGTDVIVSVDQAAEWQKAVARECDGQEVVRFFSTSMSKTECLGRIGEFYDIPEEIYRLGPFDMVFIDGPIQGGSIQPLFNRAMAGKIFRNIAKPGTVIVLDDAWRSAEMVALGLWHSMRLVRDMKIFHTTRGLAVMRLA